MAKPLKKKFGQDDIALNANWQVLEFYGEANIALLYSNLRFWIKKNEANNTNLNDGKHWTYNSVRAFAEQFPFFSEKQIANMLARLVKDGFLVSGNYNKMKQDRTKWYALGKRASE